MNAEYLRDAAMTAAIVGFFAMGWAPRAVARPASSWGSNSSRPRPVRWRWRRPASSAVYSLLSAVFAD